MTAAMLALLLAATVASQCAAWFPHPFIRKKIPTLLRCRSSVGTNASVETATDHKIVLESPVLGSIYRLGGSGNDDDDSFLKTMGVPTFACLDRRDDESLLENNQRPTPTRPRGLEGVLNQGPAFVLDRVLSKEACEQMIRDCESIGFGNYQSGKNHHGALQIVVSETIAKAVGSVLSRHVDLDKVAERRHELLEATSNGEHQNQKQEARLLFAGINRRWRVYRYDAHGNETFAPHIDAGFPPSGLTEDGKDLLWDATKPRDNQGRRELVSRLTVLLYLNDDFVGGETNFFKPGTMSLLASVRPVTGSCLVFPQAVSEAGVEYARIHWPLHEGSPVVSGRPKYVIRSDVIVATQIETLPLDDPFARYDHLVRDTFLPRSPSLDSNFLSHVSSLYNPHMGVEHLGSFLYSFLRFTKKRRVVEIGAGYTSLWILQAIKDNDDEWTKIRELQKRGQCRLLDIPWTVLDGTDNYNAPASLLCIDNCAHQKETATGASEIASGLGLDRYFQFIQTDAFEIQPSKLGGAESVDVLWCDFGVGSRMKEFVSKAWPCLKPGGFLLCHSTLTNANTRAWLEAARLRKDASVVGIPSDEYVEISLLEPHKKFQNSISIFQKRKGLDGQPYKEPIYSNYA